MQINVSPQSLLGFWNDAWNQAGDNANAFRAQLITEQCNALRRVKSGSLQSLGKNSANQSYSHYGAGEITQVQVLEVYGALVTFYDQMQGKITEEFRRSADFDYSVPQGFDFDNPVYSLVTSWIQSLDTDVMRPDITTLQLPGEGRTTGSLLFPRSQ